MSDELIQMITARLTDEFLDALPELNEEQIARLSTKFYNIINHIFNIY